MTPGESTRPWPDTSMVVRTPALASAVKDPRMRRFICAPQCFTRAKTSVSPIRVASGYCREGKRGGSATGLMLDRGLDDAVLVEKLFERRRIRVTKLDAGAIQRVLGVARVLHDDPHDA